MHRSAEAPYAARRRSRRERKPNWCDWPASEPAPGPSSRTLNVSLSSSQEHLIHMAPPSGRMEMAWCTAFSASVCSENGGLRINLQIHLKPVLIAKLFELQILPCELIFLRKFHQLTAVFF